MPFKKPHHTSEAIGVEAQGNGGHLIKPRGLNIVWGNDSRYWKLREEAAELIQVSWLEVSGVVPVVKGKKYNVTFQLNVKPDAFGWTSTTVLVMAKVGKRGSYKFREATLKTGEQNLIVPNNDDPLVIEVKARESDTDLYFGLYEVWSGKWKGGLEILKAEVVPVP